MSDNEPDQCVQHKWMYTLWAAVNSIWHGRSQMCEKCYVPRPGSGELEHHRFNKSGVCTLCTYSK